MLHPPSDSVSPRGRLRRTIGLPRDSQTERRRSASGDSVPAAVGRSPKRRSKRDTPEIYANDERDVRVRESPPGPDLAAEPLNIHRGSILGQLPAEDVGAILRSRGAEENAAGAGGGICTGWHAPRNNAANDENRRCTRRRIIRLAHVVAYRPTDRGAMHTRWIVPPGGFRSHDTPRFAS